MAQDVIGSKMPTFPSKPRPAQKFYRGATSPTRDGYGENGYTGPSSVDKIADSDRLSDVPATPDTDTVRDALVEGKTIVDDQTRDVSDELITPAYGMRLRNKKAGTYDALPAKGQGTSAAPVRKPGA